MKIWINVWRDTEDETVYVIQYGSEEECKQDISGQIGTPILLLETIVREYDLTPKP